MIQLLPCPACNQTTALAQDVSLEATLRCPHCDEEMQLGEVIASQYGAWKVISDPGTASIASRTSANTPVPEASSDDQAESDHPAADYELEPESAEGDGDADSEGKSNWTGFEPITHAQFEKLKRKQRSPIWSILQIAGGGLAAIPIALLILWHGLGRDIMDAGPTVAQYVPWIVPAKFRPPEDTDTPLGSEFDIDPSHGSDDFPTIDRSGGTPPTLAPPNSPLPEEDDATSPSEPAGTSTTDTGVPSSLDSQQELDRKSIEQEFPFTRGLFAAITRTEADLLSWKQNEASDTADNDLRKNLAKSFYGDLLSIALQLEQFPGESRAFRFVRNELKHTSAKIRRQTDVQTLIQQGAKFTLASPKVNSQAFPLAVFIRNLESKRVQGGFEIIATSTGPLEAGEAMKILIPDYLSPQIIPGQRLFVLGGIAAATSESDAPHQRVFKANYLYSFGSQDYQAADATP